MTHDQRLLTLPVESVMLGIGQDKTGKSAKSIANWRKENLTVKSTV
jgi:hypothetical protein